MRHLQFCKTHIKKLLTFAAVVAGCYLFFAAAFVVVALAMDGRRGTDFPVPDRSGSHEPNSDGGGDGWRPPGFDETQPLDPDPDRGSLFRPPAAVNFILMGIEHNNLADAIMAGTFYRDTGDIHLMSIPRDTYIHLSETRHAQIRALGLSMPRELRINALRSYGGREAGPRLIREEVGAMFGVHFHYYVEVNLAAFRRVVDDVLGGIYFTVPRHLFYVDPCQDLIIDVPAGRRRLTGAQAEGLVRYREYADADLGRNRMQLEFMTALINQVLTPEVLMGEPLELVRILVNEVNTNVSVTGMIRYLPYVVPPLGSLGEIRTFTLPGVPGYRGGRNVFLPNLNQIHDVADRVFRAHIIPEAETYPDA